MAESDGNLTVAATGDSIVTRRLPFAADRFAELSALLRTQDAALTNLELPILTGDEYATAHKGAIYFRGEPWVLDDLKSMGFNVFTAANNHIGDYSQGGVLSTIEELEKRNLAFAGIGDNLFEARAPGFLDTPSGRVAILSAATSYVPSSVAGPQSLDLPGRPGMSPLRLETRFVAPERVLRALKEYSEMIGMDAMKQMGRSGYLSDEDDEEVFHFLDVGKGPAGGLTTFEAGDSPCIKQLLNASDVAEISKYVKWADQQADFVIFSCHTHEGANGGYSGDSVPEFLETFAHACVDAGVDLFVGHGPHCLRPVEIYDGSPIFYSLGNFIPQYDTISRFPGDLYSDNNLPNGSNPGEAYEQYAGANAIGDGRYDLFRRTEWAESVVPICEFDGDTIVEVTFHPLTLRYDRTDFQRGVPSVAKDDEATDILTSLDGLSDQYGTSLAIQDGTGSLDLS